MQNLNSNNNNYSFEIAGRTFTFKSGKLARQANGAVLMENGGNGILITATMNENYREDIDFFPLVIDVEERMYAAGKIPGGFFRREGRATDKAILISRLTDRPLRPVFDKNLRNEVQVIATILSVDQVHPYDVMVMNGASCALYISDIPFFEPIGAVRIGNVDGNWIINPSYDELKKSIIDIIVAGTETAILMVEAKGHEASEEIVLEAIERAVPEIGKIIAAQIEFGKSAGIEKKQVEYFKINNEVKEKLDSLARGRIIEVLDKVAELSSSAENRALLNKGKRGYASEELDRISEEIKKEMLELYPEDNISIDMSLKELERELVRKTILEKSIRPDGRKPEEIREITCEVGLFPDTTHGTGLFTRGRTQALTILALGSVKEAQRLDSLEELEFKRYMHHYNFPPYSTGDTAALRGPKRREVGHGALAERALEPMIPNEERFPYAIRLVSEVLESNGSTSMASVCGSTLALMDGGVPILNPVSGIAMGLVKGDADDFVVLSDIQGIEDFYGDMDFKVAGTKNGITALQMDIKIKGIDIKIMRKALYQAKEGRLFILDKMLQVIPLPRENLAKVAPKITSFKIPKDKIGEIIGPGGKNIKSLKEEFDLDEIDITDSNGEGIVSITCSDQKNIGMARKKIEAMLKGIEDINEGDEFIGTVVGITSYGAFINIIPGIDGLLHISKVANKRINNVEEYIKMGDKIGVRVCSIDRRDKKISLERSDL
ncbi:MAG: Polyribonucleotide nucleotidyltransferase [Actinobacteria bacterium ADurb.Bin346]|nr:MAG: Polyribonucleotide nucleotidyltransferase [Actinobacteria bacterium ADurb.Bin346]